MAEEAFIEVSVVKDSALPELTAAKTTLAVGQICTATDVSNFSESRVSGARTMISLLEPAPPALNWETIGQDAPAYREIWVSEDYKTVTNLMRWAKPGKIYSEAEMEREWKDAMTLQRDIIANKPATFKLKKR